MYITKVLSYNGAWEKLLSEHEYLLYDIQDIFEKIDSIEDFLIDYKLQKEFIIMDYIFKINRVIPHLSDSFGWVMHKQESRKVMSHEIGYVKDGIAFTFETDPAALPIFLFQRINNINRTWKNEIHLPIMMLPNKKLLNYIFKITNQQERILKDHFNTFERVDDELLDYLPLTVNMPFLIFGIDFNQDSIEVKEVEGKKEPMTIERSITFKPEHFQAGLGILSYFGTVMRKKYPEQNAKVRIEQDGLKVRLIVETENGETETIERAIDEFGLVVHQEIEPEQFYTSYLDVAELKTKLSNFQNELNFQRQLVEMHKERAEELKTDKKILTEALKQSLVRPNSPVYVTNNISQTQNTTFSLKNEVHQTYDQLDRLINLSDNTDMKSRLRDLQNALDQIKNNDNPEDVKDSGAMKKLNKFLNEANETGTEAKGLVEKGGEALELIKKLGRGYNSIAEWCALPVIPSVFVKE